MSNAQTPNTEEPTNSPVQRVEAFLAAWNAHDGAAVVDEFAVGGTYVDPFLPGPLAGDNIAGYVTALATAMPDLAFTKGGNPRHRQSGHAGLADDRHVHRPVGRIAWSYWGSRRTARRGPDRRRTGRDSQRRRLLRPDHHAARARPRRADIRNHSRRRGARIGQVSAALTGAHCRSQPRSVIIPSIQATGRGLPRRRSAPRRWRDLVRLVDARPIDYVASRARVICCMT